MRSTSNAATTMAFAVVRKCRRSIRSVGQSAFSTTTTSKLVLEKVSARVFCPFPSMSQATTRHDDIPTAPPKSGGNPVTIFKIRSTELAASASDQRFVISPELCSQLASSCAWESVFVFPPFHDDDAAATLTPSSSSSSSSSFPPQLNMAFYLPTGQPVSFCAHAAMGGAYAYFQNPTDGISSSSSSSSSFDSLSATVQLNVLNANNEPANDVAPATIDAPPTTYVATYKRDNTDSDDDKNSSSSNNSTGSRSGSIALEVNNIVWQQEPIEHPTTLHRILREYHKVNGSTDCTLPMIEVLPTKQQWEEQNLDQYEPQILKSKYNKVIPLPSFLNSWVGDRKKTLVYINKEETLHQRILPPPSRAAEKYYPAACDSLQHTTGLYLYATKTTAKDRTADQREIKLDYPVLDPNNEDENVWECRQFPRQSGYAEDPATGVAAAALAISLRFCEIETQRILGTEDNDTISNGMLSTTPSSKYEFYQGTAMQQPSYIVVENIKVHSIVTQAEEPQLSSVTPEELSVFKYAKTVDDGMNSTSNNQAPSVMAEKINIMANKTKTIDEMDDDETLEKEAANVDLFNDVEDDDIWNDDDDDDDTDANEPSPEVDTVTSSPPPPTAQQPPKQDFRHQKHRGIVSFTLSGRIEVDAIERIELE